MRRAISVLLIAIVAAFAVAACGGEDSSPAPTKTAYQQTYKGLTKDLVALSVAVGNTINGARGKSNKQISKSFTDVADRTRTVAKAFDDATPPDDAAIKKQQEKLVDELGAVATDLDAVGEAAGKNDIKAAGKAAKELNGSTSAVTATKLALDKAVGLPVAKTPATTGGTAEK